jgi:hypothetical protein
MGELVIEERSAPRSTPCLFGAPLTLRADCSRLARVVGIARVAALPFGSRVLASEKLGVGQVYQG